MIRRLLIVLTTVTLVALALISAGGASAIELPPPPALPEPSIPPAASQILSIAAPIISPICGDAGLGPVLLGAEAGAIKPIIDPNSVLPYLNAFFALCGYVPAPEVTHVCALDKLIASGEHTIVVNVNEELSVVQAPSPEGWLVDVAMQAQSVLALPIPVSELDQLASTLGCAATAAKAAARPPSTPHATVPAVVIPSTIAPAATPLVVPVVTPAPVAVAPSPQIAAPAAPPSAVGHHQIGPRTSVVLSAAKPPVPHPVLSVLAALVLVLLGAWAWRTDRRRASRM